MALIRVIGVIKLSLMTKVDRRRRHGNDYDTPILRAWRLGDIYRYHREVELAAARRARKAALDLLCPGCGLLMLATEGGFHYCAYERAGMHHRARRFALALAVWSPPTASATCDASDDLFPQPAQLALTFERRRLR